MATARDILLPCALGAFVLGAFACGPSAPPQEPGYEAMVASNTSEPKTEVERALLQRLAALESATQPKDTAVPVSGGELSVLGTTVVLGSVYDAASGRQCRSITIEAQPRRLVCRFESDWAFVDDVFLESSQ